MLLTNSKRSLKQARIFCKKTELRYLLNSHLETNFVVFHGGIDKLVEVILNIGHKATPFSHFILGHVVTAGPVAAAATSVWPFAASIILIKLIRPY